MDYRKKFAKNFLKLRKDSGMTLKELAGVMGVTDGTVSLLEHGKRSPSFEVLCRIADHFNVSTDYLIGRSGNPKCHEQ